MNRLGMVFVCAALLVAGCGGGSDTPAPVKAKTFTATGTIKLLATGVGGDGGSGCAGTNGYDDIVEGAPVVISDAKNTKVGLGKLGQGETGEFTTCTFDFAVKDIPSGKGPYSVEVSNRGAVPFNETEATSIALSLN